MKNGDFYKEQLRFSLSSYFFFRGNELFSVAAYKFCVKTSHSFIKN